MLKKIVMFIALAAMLQGVAFAAGYATYTDLGTVFNAAGVSFKPSNNVVILFKDDAIANPQNYTIVSKNTSGDTAYATSNMSGNIYKWSPTSDTPAGSILGSTATLTMPANAGESTGWGSNWTAI
jgi:hypothetical protein